MDSEGEQEPDSEGEQEADSEEEQEADSEEDQEADSEEELDPATHKKSLEKLKKTDPDFYNFLEENDENLLNFDVESGDDASDKEDGGDDEKVHKPGPLRGDSDESDFEVTFIYLEIILNE